MMRAERKGDVYREATSDMFTLKVAPCIHGVFTGTRRSMKAYVLWSNEERGVERCIWAKEVVVKQDHAWLM